MSVISYQLSVTSFPKILFLKIVFLFAHMAQIPFFEKMVFLYLLMAQEILFFVRFFWHKYHFLKKWYFYIFAKKG